FAAQALEITELKEKVKFLEDRQGEGITLSGDDAPIKGRRLDEEEVSTERVSSDTEEGEVVAEKMEDFIPMGSKEEGERIKRKGLNLEQESGKKQKTSEEVPEEVKSSDEVPGEKIKELIQLVPIEEVYVEALQVKHHIIE
nr:hypothetical protein [Tanacetum cinerariifolium]